MCTKSHFVKALPPLNLALPVIVTANRQAPFLKFIRSYKCQHDHFPGHTRPWHYLHILQNFIPPFQRTPIRMCYARDRGGAQPAAGSAALPFDAVQVTGGGIEDSAAERYDVWCYDT